MGVERFSMCILRFRWTMCCHKQRTPSDCCTAASLQARKFDDLQEVKMTIKRTGLAKVELSRRVPQGSQV